MTPGDHWQNSYRADKCNCLVAIAWLTLVAEEWRKWTFKCSSKNNLGEEWDSDQGTKKWTVRSVNVEQPNSILADEVEGFKKKKNRTEEDLEGLLNN